jgi:hypothetical protein
MFPPRSWPGRLSVQFWTNRVVTPTRDRPDAEPGRLVVRDPWKVPPELNYGGQLAARLVHLTDGRSRRFVDTEHGAYNRRSLRAGQAKPGELAAPNRVGRRVGAPAGGLKSCRGHSPIRGASPGRRYRERPPRWHPEDGVRANADQRRDGGSIAATIARRPINPAQRKAW